MAKQTQLSLSSTEFVYIAPRSAVHFCEIIFGGSGGQKWYWVTGQSYETLYLKHVLLMEKATISAHYYFGWKLLFSRVSFIFYYHFLILFFFKCINLKKKIQRFYFLISGSCVSSIPYTSSIAFPTSYQNTFWCLSKPVLCSTIVVSQICLNSKLLKRQTLEKTKS